jgi:type VI secretion system protein VasD
MASRTAWLAILVLSGCGVDAVFVRGIRPLNMNDKGESTPVNIRVYQLKDNRKFLDSVFEDLWLKDKEVLGEDLLGEATVATVLPGSRDDGPQKVEIGEIASGTLYIGVMSLFARQSTGQDRRRTVRVEDSDHVVFELAGYGISLSKDESFRKIDARTPVEIRIHQLKDDKLFLESDFDDLWAACEKTLGETWIADPMTETVYLGKERDSPMTLEVGKADIAARYIGIAARFELEDAERKHRGVLRLGERSESYYQLHGNGIIFKLERD